MEKIEKTNLTDKVFTFIQEQITSGEWKTGDKLPSENELSEMLGVSRMTLRTAIQKTNVMGLTETKVGDGTYVKKFSMRPFMKETFKSSLIDASHQDIARTRNILEIGSVRMAMSLEDYPKEIQYLEGLFAEMEAAAADDDIDRFHKLDTKFHRSVCRSCHNELLYVIYDAIEYMMDDIAYKNILHSIQFNHGYKTALEHHGNYIKYMKARDIEGFAKNLKDADNRDSIYLQKYGD